MFCKISWPTVRGSINSEFILFTASSFQHSFLVPCSITSYGNRPNDYESVVNYFRAHFLQVHRKNNEKKRVLYSHLTNAVVWCQAGLLVFPFRSCPTIRISKRHEVSLLMVGFMRLYRSQRQLFIICSSRFHIQGLLEIRCSRVKAKHSRFHGYLITLPRPSCVSRWFWKTSCIHAPIGSRG